MWNDLFEIWNDSLQNLALIFNQQIITKNLDLVTNPNGIEYNMTNKVISYHIVAIVLFLTKIGWSFILKICQQWKNNNLLLFFPFLVTILIFQVRHAAVRIQQALSGKITKWFLQGVIKTIFLYIKQCFYYFMNKPLLIFRLKVEQ